MLEYVQGIDIEATNYGAILSNGDAKYQKDSHSMQITNGCFFMP